MTGHVSGQRHSLGSHSQRRESIDAGLKTGVLSRSQVLLHDQPSAQDILTTGATVIGPTAEHLSTRASRLATCHGVTRITRSEPTQRREMRVPIGAG